MIAENNATADCHESGHVDFRRSRSECLDSPHNLLEFDKAPDELESILAKFYGYLQSLGHVAPIQSDEDAGTISAWVGLNRQASGRAGLEPDEGPQAWLLGPADHRDPILPDD